MLTFPKMISSSVPPNVEGKPRRIIEGRCYANTTPFSVLNIGHLGCLNKHRLWRQAGVLVGELLHYFSSQQPLWFKGTSQPPALHSGWNFLKIRLSILAVQTDHCLGQRGWHWQRTRCEVPFLGFLSTLVTLFRGSGGCGGFGEREGTLLSGTFIILASCTRWRRGKVNVESVLFRDRDRK